MKGEPRNVAEIQAHYVEKSVPLLYRNLVQRAFAGTLSPRQAIKAHCLACSNFQREEVEHCTVVRCPLHAFRPYVRRAEALGDATGSEGTSTLPQSCNTPETLRGSEVAGVSGGAT